MRKINARQPVGNSGMRFLRSLGRNGKTEARISHGATVKRSRAKIAKLAKERSLKNKGFTRSAGGRRRMGLDLLREARQRSCEPFLPLCFFLGVLRVLGCVRPSLTSLLN